MKRILKMTDITPFEVQRELSLVRYSTLLSPEIVETQEGVVLACEVNQDNRVVFAQVFAALAEFVYSDSEETALERFCNLVDVRNLKIGLFEQGTRGKIARAMLSSKFALDDNMIASVIISTIKNAASDSSQAFLNKLKAECDVVIETLADFEKDPLVPTRCHIRLTFDGDTGEKQYDFLGNSEDVAERLTFFAIATAIKKIF